MKRVTLTLDDDLYARLEAEAEHEQRRLSDQIAIVLERMYVEGKVGPVEQVRALALLEERLNERFDDLRSLIQEDRQPTRAVGFEVKSGEGGWNTVAPPITFGKTVGG